MEENARTIGALIEHYARRYRDKPYLCFGDQHVSYEEIHRVAQKRHGTGHEAPVN